MAKTFNADSFFTAAYNGGFQNGGYQAGFPSIPNNGFQPSGYQNGVYSGSYQPNRLGNDGLGFGGGYQQQQGYF